MIVKEKPTVLIVENSLDITGAFNSILSYARYTRYTYRYVFVLSKKSRLVEKVLAEGFSAETLPFREINKNPVNLFLYFPTLLSNAIRLRRIAHKQRAVIVHVNDFYNLVGAVAKALGGKFVLLTHVRFMPDRFPALLVQGWMRINLAYSEYIICVSQAVIKCLTSHPKLQVIYDGLSALPKSNLQQKVLESSRINLLCLAHYIPGKGQDMALEAFHQAYRQNDNLRLRFVGGDMGLKKNQQYRKRLEQRAKVLSIQSVVTFAGPTTDVVCELNSTDIFLNFSESESFSMTCLEALAQGIPLIATNCGGPAELFEHGKSGYLIPDQDIEAGTQFILELAANSTLRLRFAENSICYIRRKFSEKNTRKKLADLYAKVLPC